jgi:ABC-type phosphate transport system substrate-binding protein
MGASVKNLYMRRAITTVVIVLITSWAPQARPAETDPIAIVVRPDLPIEDLSFAELRRVMLGDRQYWSSSLRITLLVRAPGSHERDIVLKTIYQMTEAQFRQYWIAKVFRAEAPTGPRIVYSSDMAAELALAIPGAVTFVDAAQVPPGLKVLKINGRLPREAGYPLR